MSDVDPKEAARKASDAKKRANADTKAAQEAPAENPQREWIDTLLMAAVMTRSKKKHTEGTAVATTAVAAPATKVEDARATETSTPEIVAIKEGPPTENAPQNAGQQQNATGSTASQQEPDAEATTAEQDDEKRYRRRRCEEPGCTKFARFNNACSGHGGRRLCSQPGCKRVAQFGHKCSGHGGVKYCSVEGCKRAVQSRGFCKTHGGGVRCKHPGCEKGAISKGHCRAHGGGSRCAEEGCQKWAQRHGFCVRHSKTTTGATEDAEAVDSAQV